MTDHAPKTLGIRTCRQCGSEFLGGPRAWYCPTCREERKKRHDREFKERKRAGKVIPVGSSIRCETCGKDMIKNGGFHRFCDECAANHLKQVDNAQSIAWNKSHPAEALSAKRNSKGKERTCVVCGKTFIGDGTRRNTCSSACKKEQTRQCRRRADIKRGKIQDPSF